MKTDTQVRNKDNICTAKYSNNSGRKWEYRLCRQCACGQITTRPDCSECRRINMTGV